MLQCYYSIKHVDVTTLIKKVETFDIACYTRISVDDESDKENTSIENQKAIISDYVNKNFPGSRTTFFEDRDRSGYTFLQREGYQEMRKCLLSHHFDILIIKDLSRFSRRNGEGLVELEKLRDADVRIIAIGDNIDYPTNDDWIKIQIYFLLNEMPVTDTSKKVRNVIKMRQEEGKWICSVPYGYVITNSKLMTFKIDPPAAQIVKLIFDLYLNSGWGYKKIANYLTAENIPTPRMNERNRMEAEGKPCNIKAKTSWSLVTISEILSNDFYIGTLRQRKYARKKINGIDEKKDDMEHIVFENHHEAIIDFKTFSNAQDELKRRTQSNYRGVKKYPNSYSGVLRCGDCGSPMFSLSRPGKLAAYHCGAYANRGLKGCTSHHVRVDFLDMILKQYISTLKETSSEMIDRLTKAIVNENIEIDKSEDSLEILQKQLEDAKAERAHLIRSRTRDLMKHPDSEELIEESYESLINDCDKRITGLNNQLILCNDQRNTIIRANRTAKEVITVIDRLLNKDNLDKQDINFLVDAIYIYEDHIHIKLKADIESILASGKLPDYHASEEENIVNFQSDIIDILSFKATQKSEKHLSKVYDVNVISEGDPLLTTLTKEEIFLHGILNIEKRIKKE